MISIIIPTLNEAPNLPDLLQSLSHDEMDIEIIIVDGGSTDSTIDISEQYGARIMETRPGRGHQLRTGADISTGDILWFLHADCKISRGALDAIQRLLITNPQMVGGNFRLLFDGNDDFSRWLNGFYARIRARGFYYGDSGVFVRRDTYQELGGLRPLALMEDYDFNRRLERIGQTGIINDAPLVTSSRRFEGRHKWHIISEWLLIHALFYLRVPSPILAWIYNAQRHRHTAYREPSFSDQS